MIIYSSIFFGLFCQCSAAFYIWISNVYFLIFKNRIHHERFRFLGKNLSDTTVTWWTMKQKSCTIQVCHLEVQAHGSEKKMFYHKEYLKGASIFVHRLMSTQAQGCHYSLLRWTFGKLLQLCVTLNHTNCMLSFFIIVFKPHKLTFCIPNAWFLFQVLGNQHW
jgi:hypothetical protein